MLLKLTRKWFTDESTIGELLIDNIFECYTLEDPVREGDKIPGKTAIPSGRYPVVITFSQRFQRYMPLVKYVNNFTGIRIHIGNSAKDTEGCILVGRTRSRNWVGNSRVAFDALYPKLQDALLAGESVVLMVTSAEGSRYDNT